MKKRNAAIRALAVLLTCTMVGTSVPAAGQEVFESGVRQETKENTSDVEEFQSSQADEFGTDTESDAERRSRRRKYRREYRWNSIYQRPSVDRRGEKRRVRTF